MPPESSNQYLKVQDSGHSADHTAWDALSQGVSDGFGARWNEMKKEPLAAVGEVVGAGVMGAVLGAASGTTAGKAALIGFGVFTAVDLGSRLVNTVGSMIDVSHHPDHFERDKQQIAGSLGRGIFDYGLLGIAGGIGYKAGSSMFGARNMLGAMSLGEPITGTRVAVANGPAEASSSALKSVYADAVRMGSDDHIAIPQYVTGLNGIKEPSILMADRNSVLGRLYLDNRESIVRITGANSRTGASGVGTGFFVKPESMPDPLIFTNNHVVSGFDQFSARTFDGHEYWLRVIARDKAADVALAQVLNKPPGVVFRPLELAQTGTGLAHNSYVTAIGHPAGVPQEVMAMGRVKALAIETDNPVMDIRGVNHNLGVADLITDVPVRPGYSGSPLIGEDGKVVGVVKFDMGDKSAATVVDHMRLLQHEAEASSPNGYLDIHSLFDAQGRLVKVSQSEGMQFPIDGNSPKLVTPAYMYELRPQLRAA